MKSAKFILSLVSVLAVFSLTACFGTPAQPTIDYQALINTSVAQTQAAEIPGTEVAPTTATTSLPTATLQPTNTPLPTFTSIPTYAPTAVPCYAMGYVKDITIKDGTNEPAGADFTKTWRLRNMGYCTWTTSFKLKFVSGDQMNAATYTSLPKNVAPGGLVDVSVDMTAPSSSGTYLGNYKMKAADGTIFGAGVGGVPIFVKIVVTGPLFRVTNVDDWTVVKDCAGHTVFTADITTNAAGRVDTHWVFEDLDVAHLNPTTIIGPSDHIDFSGAQTKTVTATWNFLTFWGPGQAYIYIDTPNHQLFGPGGSFTCP